MAADSQLNQIKAKKIGLFLRDARTSANKTIRECSDAIGVTPHRFKLYEAGELSPSLPELEALSYFLGIKLSHFFGDQFISEETVKGELPTTVDQYKLLRHRVIGTHLRLVRSELKTSLKDLSAKTMISTSRLAKYEKGESSIPLLELELIAKQLKIPLPELFVQSGKVGKWRKQQDLMEQFFQLPEELQSFVCQPVNRPYIELAVRFSKLSAGQLRSIAEGLLEITY